MANYQERVGQLRSEFDKKRLETRAQRDAAKAPSEKIQAMRAATDAKIAARRQASDAAYAARQAARKAPPTIPAPPPNVPGFDLPSPGRGAPTSPGSRLGNAMAGRSTGLAGNAPMAPMPAMGENMQMIKSGGMTKGKGRDGCAIRGKTRA